MSITTPVPAKKKRRGEEHLFNEQGKLTDEAIHMARIAGVDPRSLYPRSIDSFAKKGITAKEAEKQKLAFDQQREDLISMVLSSMKEATGRRSVQSKSSNVLKNLSLPQEERILRSAYRQ